MTCDRYDECGHNGRPNSCEGDGRLHHHGRIHTRAGALEWLCGSHAAYDRQEWIDFRNGKTIEQVLSVGARR